MRNLNSEFNLIKKLRFWKIAAPRVYKHISQNNLCHFEYCKFVFIASYYQSLSG